VLFLLLLILFALAAIAVALFAMGCIQAARAGQGSRSGLVVWLCIVAVELLPLLTGVPLIFVIVAVAVGIQTVIYLGVRSGRPPVPPGGTTE
jgi:hypothetical protein